MFKEFSPNQIVEIIKAFAALISAILVIVGVPVSIKKWYDKYQQKKIDEIEAEKERIEKDIEQDKKIQSMQTELTLVCYSVSACLDGLMQMGCNHSVPDAKDKLDKYLNKKAHEQE